MQSTMLSCTLTLLLGILTHSIGWGQCATPTNLHPLTIQTSSVDLGWNPVSGARSYRIKYKPVGASSWATKRVRSTSISIGGLASGTDYQWKIRTICRGGSSQYSPLAYFTTLGSCPTPTPFNPLGIGSHQSTLVWSNLNAQVNSYQVRWRALGDITWHEVAHISTNLYIIYGLIPQTTYEYQVRSNCAGSTSVYSNSVRWTTPENVCTAPTGMTTTHIGTDFASLTWNAVGGTEHYRVRYRASASGTWLYKDFIGGTSTTIEGLFPNTNYESQVQSECTLGATEWSAPILFTTDQIPSCEIPQHIIASMITASSAKHSWNAVIGAVGYTMRRKVAGPGSWTNQFNTSEPSITTYLLDAGTTYEFQVQTHCNIGSSSWSSSIFYTTQGDPPCPQATNLVVNDITPTSADFDWDNVAGILTYQFQWRIMGSSSWSTVVTSSSHLGRTGLTPASTYEWRIGSLCTSGGTYTYTSIQTFQTAASGQCTVPSGLFVLGVGQTQATLIWSSIPEASNYDARYRLVGSMNWIDLTGISSNLKVVTGLTPGTNYEWQVSANCTSGGSPYSASDLFTTQVSADAGLEQTLIKGEVMRINGHPHQSSHISLYPNPTSGDIHIFSGNRDEYFDMMIHHLDGKLLYRQRLISNRDRETTVSLKRAGLESGMYLITLISDEGKRKVDRLIVR